MNPWEVVFCDGQRVQAAMGGSESNLSSEDSRNGNCDVQDSKSADWNLGLY